jgi:hypothetical protein
MNYLVKFRFSTINKQSKVMGREGSMELTSEQSPEELMDNSELVPSIASELSKTIRNCKIISLDIIEIVEA